MEPKNWWFVNVSPFPRGYFQVPAVCFRGCIYLWRFWVFFDPSFFPRVWCDLSFYPFFIFQRLWRVHHFGEFYLQPSKCLEKCDVAFVFNAWKSSPIFFHEPSPNPTWPPPPPALQSTTPKSLDLASRRARVSLSYRVESSSDSLLRYAKGFTQL